MSTTGGVLYMHKFIGGERLLLTGLLVNIIFNVYIVDSVIRVAYICSSERFTFRYDFIYCI
jgi:hypothetical protein